jgi:hypothetical protein
MPVAYEGVGLDAGYRLDLLVENSVTIMEVGCTTDRVVLIGPAQ